MGASWYPLAMRIVRTFGRITGLLLVLSTGCGAAARHHVASTATESVDRAQATARETSLPSEEFVPGMSDEFWQRHDEIVVDGQVVPVTRGVPDALRAPASRVLACDAEHVVGRWTRFGSPHSPMAVVLVEGCGQHLVYAFVMPDESGGPHEHLELWSLGNARVDGAP